MDTIDIQTVSALELEVAPSTPVYGLITVAGRLYLCEGITSTGHNNLTVGYVPYEVPESMRTDETMADVLTLAVPTVPDRMFADADATYARGVFFDGKDRYVYMNGSAEDQKVCVWNSPKKMV